MHTLPLILTDCWLFRGLDAQEISAVLGCIDAQQHTYPKHSFIFHAGDCVTRAGIVVRGELHIVREDVWGNRIIQAVCRPADLFGEVFACLPDHTADVSVVATQDTEILFLDMQHLLTTCSNGCRFHNQLIHNYITVLAQKNRMLSSKIRHCTQRTTRSKVLSYLSEQAMAAGSTTFRIPLNRQQLADYLSVDRSALSAELSRLQTEGKLRFHRNQFTLLASAEGLGESKPPVEPVV